MIKTIIRRLSAQLSVLAGGLALLAVVVGVITASLGHFRPALVTVIVLQAVIVLLLLIGGPKQQNSAAVQRHIDEASTRVLADISRARQAILAAVDDLSERR
jgi:cytochrome c oxidase assembly factor CtaG